MSTKNLKVTVKNQSSEWTEVWEGYSSSITQTKAESTAREAISQFNDVEKSRYGAKADQREFVSVEIVTPAPALSLDYDEEEDDE